MGQHPAGPEEMPSHGVPWPIGFLAARVGNPPSVTAKLLQPMSGGQNHKGIQRLNIFLGAGCRDELGKGVWLGIFGLIAFLEMVRPRWGKLLGVTFLPS